MKIAFALQGMSNKNLLYFIISYLNYYIYAYLNKLYLFEYYIYKSIRGDFMEIALLVLAVSIDSFVASIHYGIKKIKIPFSSILIINLISSSFLGLSIFLGKEAQKFFPMGMTSMISFIILSLLGVYYLFEGLIKFYLESKKDSKGEIEVKFADIRFMINIYIDGTKADKDKSKILDYKEAIYLAIALSLDSLTIGFGSGLSNMNYLKIMFFAFLAGFFSIFSGLKIGERLSKEIRFNLSWLSGIILIILAFLRLF